MLMVTNTSLQIRRYKFHNNYFYIDPRLRLYSSNIFLCLSGILVDTESVSLIARNKLFKKDVHFVFLNVSPNCVFHSQNEATTKQITENFGKERLI